MQRQVKWFGSVVIGISALGCISPEGTTSSGENTAKAVLPLEAVDFGEGLNFQATRPPFQAAAGRSAVRLHDGSVLLFGDSGASGLPAQSVERFDPITQKWMRLKPTPHPHTSGHAMTLPNGNVLLLSAEMNGNLNAIGVSADLLDPSVKRWTTGATINMVVHAPPVLLKDGKALVLGQTAGNDAPQAKILDTQTLTWTDCAPPSILRKSPVVVAMADGHILVAGGSYSTTDNSGTPLDSAEMYDPDLDQWFPLPNSYDTHAEASGFLLLTGEVLLIDTSKGKTESYNPTTGRWTWRTPLPASSTPNFSLSGARTVITGEDQVLVIGGSAGEGVEVDNWMYDAKSDTWTSLGRLLTSRHQHTATLLNDGNVLIAGGLSVFSGQKLQNAELYAAPVSPWKIKELDEPLATAPAATRLDDGLVLLSGLSADHAQSMIFDPQDDSLRPTARLLEPRMTHDAVLLPDGRVLAAGGYTMNPVAPLNTTEIFDPASSQWIAGPNLPGPIGQPKLVRLADGRILAASLDATPAPSVKSLLLLDPKSMQWSTLQITIPDQQIMDLIATDTAHVVLLGRESEAAPPLLTTIHLEAKTISLFTPTDLYPTGSGALMPLLDGHVVVTSYISKSRIGIFDPVQLSWDFLGHADFTPPMARLVGGQVLWAGSQAATPKAGLFDPTTREVLQVERPIAKMLTTATIATPLLDGRVLVTASVQDSNATMLLYGKQNGTACKAAGECMSGHCVDGYCCDTACNDSGACQTCSVGRGATTNGTCATLLQCAPNQCKEIVPTPNTQTAACTSACVRASDCAEGYVCNINGACVAPANYDIPFTCAWTGNDSTRAHGASAGCLAVVLAFFGRRRRRVNSADKPVTTGRKSDNFFS